MSKNLQGEIPKGEHGDSRNSVTKQAKKEASSDKKKQGYDHLSFEASMKDEDAPPVRKISYEDCIDYFVANEPPEFSRAAILLQKIGYFPFTNRYKITQVYLDANDELVRDAKGHVWGRSFSADSLDDELKYAFGKHKILIIE